MHRTFSCYIYLVFFAVLQIIDIRELTGCGCAGPKQTEATRCLGPLICVSGNKTLLTASASIVGLIAQTDSECCLRDNKKEK